MFRQRGALTVITPLLMLLVILLGVMALDGARLFSLRKEMQSQVNAAATAAADAAQACGGEFVALQDINNRALIAAQQQGFSGDASSLVVQPGVIESDDEKVLSFEPVTDLRRSNGVAVTYEREAPISLLLPESTFGTVTMSVGAAARKELIGTLSAAGSTAVVGGTQQTANLLNVLLGAILNGGTPFNIDPTQFSSLAETTVKLGDVLEGVGVDTVEELLSTDVLVGNLLGALDSAADPLADVGGAMDQLISGVGVETVKLADVIDIVGSGEIPENSRLPLYDTVMALALNLVEGTLIEGALPDTQVNIPGVTETKIELFVGKAPSVVVGPARIGEDGEWETRFHAPDVGLTISSDLNILNLLTVRLPLAVQAGGGTGELVWARCARGTGSNLVTVGIDVENQAARIATGQIDGSGFLQQEPVELTVLGDLPGGLTVASITADLDLAVGGGQERVELSYTLDEDNPSSVFTEGGLSDADFSSLNIDVELLEEEDECSWFLDCLLDGVGDVLSGIIEGITTLLGLEQLIQTTIEGLVEALGTTLIDPLLNAIGISLGTTKVEITGADQNNVQLLEYCGPEGC
ncbi:hypothetical protein [Alloalcanivorax venustensis]|jgi:uncharacterized membrane protein|uniref:hypothetical protein n=1 Tax=Alloalcanivorax venustensis TaxID=172371 RepID=UPI003512AC3A